MTSRQSNNNNLRSKVNFEEVKTVIQRTVLQQKNNNIADEEDEEEIPSFELTSDKFQKKCPTQAVKQNDVDIMMMGCPA